MQSSDHPKPYRVMPINFKNIDEMILVTTDHGDFTWISISDFDLLLRGELGAQSKVYQDLKSKQIIATDIELAVDMASAKLRSRKKFLYDFTSLHMLVTTVRCNQRCEYCQISCEDDDAYKYDMSVETAYQIVDKIFETPSESIKIEFQGGEPTLNWPVIKHVVEYAEEKNLSKNKRLDLVLCTNLTAITEKKLEFLAEHGVYISTSLDGPKEVHNFGRKLRIGDSAYDVFIDNLLLARAVVGEDRVNALMTTTRRSLSCPKEIIDEYLARGFNGLFLRALNPYGFAAEQRDILGYDAESFVDFYKECLGYIFELNKQGTFVTEYYTALLFARMMTSQSTGFVDLQSPSGAVISAVIYDYNGDVYPADEARMLARMGDKHFCMGNVSTSNFGDIFGSNVAKDVVANSCLEVVPGCAYCVYRPYCGADPIRNYLEFGDVIGKQPGSAFCLKNKKIFEFLFKLVHENDPEIMSILWSWIIPSDEGVQHEVV